MKGNADKGPQKQDYDLGYGNAGKGPENPYFPSPERGNNYDSLQSEAMKYSEGRLKGQIRRKY